MELPWISREHRDDLLLALEANAKMAEMYRIYFNEERAKNDRIVVEMLTMRKNGFEIIDTRPIEQPPTVDEQDAIAAVEAEKKELSSAS